MQKMPGIVWVQATVPALFTLEVGSTSLKPMVMSPLIPVGFGLGPKLLRPLLRSYSGSSPIEINKIAPWHSRPRCQEDF